MPFIVESIPCISFFFHLTDAPWGSSLKLNYRLCKVALNSYLIICAYLDKQTIVKWKGEVNKGQNEIHANSREQFFFLPSHAFFPPTFLIKSHSRLWQKLRKGNEDGPSIISDWVIKCSGSMRFLIFPHATGCLPGCRVTEWISLRLKVWRCDRGRGPLQFTVNY